MAANVEQVNTAMDSLEVNDVNATLCDTTEADDYEQTWGFPLEQLYKLALSFYKGIYVIFSIH